MTPAAPTDTLGRVPNQPKTPVKCFRCSEEQWQRAIAAANERGEILSEEVRKFIDGYVTGSFAYVSPQAPQSSE
jgi:hypothetical protein